MQNLERFKDSLVIDNEQIRIDELGAIIEPKRKYENDCKTYSIKDFLENNKIVLFALGRITRRILLNEFGEFHKDCPTEDLTTVLRALMMGKFTKTGKPPNLLQNTRE